MNGPSLSKHVLVGLALTASLQVSAQEAARDLTLEESIAIAIKEASLVLKADSDADVRAEQLTQSYLQWLPNLTLQAGINANRGRSYLTTAAPATVQGASYGPSYQIASVLNIFNGLSDISAFKSIRDKKTAADQTLVRVEQQIALDISQAYLQVILDAKLVAIAQNNFNISQDRQKLLSAQSQVGARSLADLFRQQAQTSADESALITARNRFETDKINLLKRMRMDPRTLVNLREPALKQNIELLRSENEKVANVEVLTEQALVNRADYEASKRLADAAQNDVSVAKAPYFPRLDFVTTYGSLARDFDFQRVNGADVTPQDEASFGDQLSDHANYTYGLALTWNIFDRGTTRSSVAVMRGTAYRAKIDAEDYRNQIIGDVKQAVHDKATTVQQLVTSQAGLVAAQKAYEVSAGRYEVGSLSFIDLSAAQIALFQAQTNLAQATISYELQKRVMAYVVGAPPQR